MSAQELEILIRGTPTALVELSPRTNECIVAFTKASKIMAIRNSQILFEAQVNSIVRNMRVLTQLKPNIVGYADNGFVCLFDTETGQSEKIFALGTSNSLASFVFA